MEITQRTETIIKIISIIILVILNLVIYINGKDLSCDTCDVNFVFENQHFKNNVSVNVLKLYEDYIEDYCYIKFTDNGVVIRNNGIK